METKRIVVFQVSSRHHMDYFGLKFGSLERNQVDLERRNRSYKKNNEDIVTKNL